MTANRFCRLSIRISLFLLLFITPWICAQAQLQTYGDILVEVERRHIQVVGSGYGEYRALVSNSSTTQPHRVAVVLIFLDFGPGSVKQLKREVEVAPKSSATVSMFIPLLEYPNTTEVIIDGQRQREQLQVASKEGTVDTGDRTFGLLLSPQIFKSGALRNSNFEEGFKNPAGEKVVATQSYELPVTEWSTNWLSFARYDGIAISGDELNAAAESVRTALLRYVERGGALLVIGNWQVPPQWQARQGFITHDEVKSEDDEDSEEIVAAAVSPTPAASPRPSGTADNVLTIQMTKPAFLPVASQAQSATDLRVYFIGFGTVTLTGAVAPSQVTVNQWKWTSRNFRESRPAEGRGYYTVADLNRAFQVVETFGVPMRGLFLLMFLFVIVIGPINLFWLARRKRKIWMLWTVPAISLMTCLIVAGFALFGEGWSATARTEALTILDETAHRATTIGWTAFYSPITPSEGLHFSYDTELDPQVSEGSYYRRPVSNRTMDWTNDQHLDSGWVTARIPAFFKLRKSETRRERLNIQPAAGGAATLVNGLGAEISQVWWADADGKIHAATNIPAGAEARLQATELKALAGVSRLREAFSEDWLEQFKLFTEKPQEALMPNSYLAVLESSPFVEEGLNGVKNRKGRSLVYGLSAGGR